MRRKALNRNSCLKKKRRIKRRVELMRLKNNKLSECENNMEISEISI
ncbi:hypothetical protein [uncultured Clostridium sp.]|nr:hypothetical protein [uncultured Clostridium sp.]